MLPLGQTRRSKLVSLPTSLRCDRSRRCACARGACADVVATLKAAKERKQREYAAELQRQIEENKIRKQREKTHDRLQSRELLSAAQQGGNTVIPFGYEEDGNLDGVHTPLGHDRPQQVHHQPPQGDHRIDAGADHGYVGSHIQPEQPGANNVRLAPPMRHDAQPQYPQGAHYEQPQQAVAPPMYDADAHKAPARPVVLKQAVAHGSHAGPAPPPIRHPKAPYVVPQVLEENTNRPIHADKFKPTETFMRKLEEERRKLAYGEELRQQMAEQKARKEKERRRWKFGEEDTMVAARSPPARSPGFAQQAQRQHAGRAPDAMTPSHAHAHALDDPSPQELLLQNEYAHLYRESSQVPSYLAGAAKRPPMVHFRSDHRNMSEQEMERKLKAAAQLQQDLLNQMEEKKAEKRRKKEEQMREEQRELERIKREQEQLRAQYEGEFKREHKSRRAHAAPFIDLSSNNDNDGGETQHQPPNFTTPTRERPPKAAARTTHASASRADPEEPPPRARSRPAVHPGASEAARGAVGVGAEAPAPGRDERMAGAQTGALSTELIRKTESKLVTSVDSINKQIADNQAKLMEEINSQRAVFAAESEVTRQEMHEMKNILQEYQDSLQKLENMHIDMQLQSQREEEHAQPRTPENLRMPPAMGLEMPSSYPSDAAQGGGGGMGVGVPSTPSWLKQVMSQNDRVLDLMQSLQAESTLVYPQAGTKQDAYGRDAGDDLAPASAHMPRVIENAPVDMRLETDTNYYEDSAQWQQRNYGMDFRLNQATALETQDEPAGSTYHKSSYESPEDKAGLGGGGGRAEGPGFDVGELYAQNEYKLKMLEQMEGVDDDEMDRRLSEFLLAGGAGGGGVGGMGGVGGVGMGLRAGEPGDFDSAPMGDLEEDHDFVITDALLEPKRMATPALPTESDWIRG